MKKSTLVLTMAELRLDIWPSQLDYLLHEFYHFLHDKGAIADDEACMKCRELVWDFVRQQKWEIE